MAYLTKFSRDGKPIVQQHDGQNYIEALSSYSVVWVLQFSAINYDAALNVAASELRAGHGLITTTGQFEGWEFPSKNLRQSAQSADNKSEARR